MQANIKVGQDDPDALLETVRERDIDILTVQENTDGSGEALRAAGIDELLPHQFVVSYGDEGLGGAIYSRHPLSNTRILTGYLSANLTADVDVGLGSRWCSSPFLRHPFTSSRPGCGPRNCAASTRR